MAAGEQERNFVAQIKRFIDEREDHSSQMRTLQFLLNHFHQRVNMIGTVI